MTGRELQDHKLTLRDLVFLTSLFLIVAGFALKLGHMDEKLDRVVMVVDRIAPPTPVVAKKPQPMRAPAAMAMVP